MNFTEEELRLIKSSPRLKRACSDSDRLREIRELLDDYERQHLAPRNLQFAGALLPRIASIVRNTKMTNAESEAFYEKQS